MTIGIVGTPTISATLAAVPAADASTVDGDIIIVDISSDNNEAPTPPAGFTLIQTHDHTTTDYNLYSYEKEASSESGTYNFGTGTLVLCSTTVYHDSVGGGTWSIPDKSIKEADSATITTDSVTLASGDLLHCSYGNDNTRTVSTPPSGMTAGAGSSSNGQALFNYHQLTSGAVTKTLVWNATEQTIASAVVLRYTVAGGLSIPVAMNQLRNQGVS